MTKTEMAEWLIKNVLKADKHESDTMNVWCLNPGLIETANLYEFFYSPDGFFAVWDAVEEKRNYCTMIKTKEGDYICHLSNNSDLTRSRSKDRYEAFYNAVYEAMNEKTTKSP